MNMHTFHQTLLFSTLSKNNFCVELHEFKINEVLNPPTKLIFQWKMAVKSTGQNELIKNRIYPIYLLWALPCFSMRIHLQVRVCKQTLGIERPGERY